MNSEYMFELLTGENTKQTPEFRFQEIIIYV